MRLEVDESLEGIRWEGVRACDAFEGGGCEWNPPEGSPPEDWQVAAEAEVQRLRQCLEIFAVQSAQQSQFALAQAGLLTTDASTANSQIQDLLEPAKPEVCD